MVTLRDNGAVTNARVARTEFRRNSLDRDRTDDLFELLDDLEEATGGPHRWPLTRSGERDQIPWLTKCAVYARDEACCQVCGYYRPKPSNMDHVVPWSAGGSDLSHNLRLTCEPCNQNRSNFHDWAERTLLRPVTWWCCFCYPDDHTWTYHGSDGDDERFCGCDPCRVPRVFQSKPGLNLPEDIDYKATDPIARALADVFVFCAHCDTHGYTEPRCVL